MLKSLIVKYQTRRWDKPRTAVASTATVASRAAPAKRGGPRGWLGELPLAFAERAQFDLDAFVDPDLGPRGNGYRTELAQHNTHRCAAGE